MLGESEEEEEIPCTSARAKPMREASTPGERCERRGDSQEGKGKGKKRNGRIRAAAALVVGARGVIAAGEKGRWHA